MSRNPALEAVLAAYRDCGDARLLGSAFDLAGDDSDRRKVIDEALAAATIGDEVREKMARASLDMGDMKAAVELSGDRPELLAVQTEAMIGMGQLAEAEARYLKLVAENPLLESPDVAKLIEEGEGIPPRPSSARTSSASPPPPAASARARARATTKPKLRARCSARPPPRSASTTSAASKR